MPEFLNTSRHVQQKDYPYFRQLRNKVVMALLLVSLLPLLTIGKI